MVGAYEARVAVLLEQESIDVLRRVVQGIPGARPETLGHAVRRRTVYVDLARSAGLQELSDEEFVCIFGCRKKEWFDKVSDITIIDFERRKRRLSSLRIYVPCKLLLVR